MSYLTSILCGIVQGLTEFLPVSSSGHLAIFQAIVGDVTGNPLPEPVAFDVLLHLGTLLAVILLYFKEIIVLVPGFFTMLGKFFKGKRRFSEYNENERFVLLILVATLPLVVGALLEHYLDFLDLLSGMLPVVGGILILNGILLFFSDKAARGRLTVGDATPKMAFGIGACQLLAILPGLSRSGSTITGGLLAGFTRETAVKFSFIMSLPAIAGACVLHLPDLFDAGVSGGEAAVYLAGAVSAMLVGLAAMKLLKWIAEKASFKCFSFYCFAAGAATIVYGFLR